MCIRDRVWFLAPPIVYAAGAEARDANPNDEIQEIIVTAQRHAERLQDVPMSITTFSQENLDQAGLRNIDDMSRLTPGLTFLRNGGTSSVGNYNDEGSDVSVRGVDSTAGTSTIGIYIDDTPVSYTHLDVYKRQIPACCSIRTCPTNTGPTTPT